MPAAEGQGPAVASTRVLPGSCRLAPLQCPGSGGWRGAQPACGPSPRTPLHGLNSVGCLPLRLFLASAAPATHPQFWIPEPSQPWGWACGVKAGGQVQGHVAGGGSPSQGLSHSGVRGPGWCARVLPSADTSVGTHVPTARVGCGAGGPPCWARWGPAAVGESRWIFGAARVRRSSLSPRT